MNKEDEAPSRTRPGAWIVLGLLTAINLFNYIDRQILAAVLPKIGETFFGNAEDKFAKAKLGSLQTAFIVSYMIFAPIFGWLADRYSRWILCGISVAIWSLASGASGLATSFTLLLVTRMFVGIGEAGYGPAAPTIISDVYSTRRRASAFAFFYLALPLGSALGYVLGGQISAWFGSWRAAFIAVTLPGLLLAFVCFFMRDPRQPKQERRARPRRARWKDYLDLLRNRSYLLDCAGMAMMTFAIGGISLWIPTYIIQFRQAGDQAHVNTVFGIVVFVSGLVATVLGGWVSDKLAERFPGAYFWVSGIGILISCPFVLLMLVLPFPYAWWAIAGAVFFLFFNTGPSNTILANVTAPTIRSTAFAVNIFIIHALGDAVSPPVLGAIVGKDRWNIAFTVVTVIMALAGILWLWGAQYLAEDTRRASGPGTPSGASPAAAKA